MKKQTLLQTSRITSIFIAIHLLTYLGLFSNSALAQEARSRNRLLEEVLVTAQKREQNLQDVPVSVTAFSGDSLRLWVSMTPLTCKPSPQA
jgi:outer membrane receptor protein involved in Fe transport